MLKLKGVKRFEQDIYYLAAYCLFLRGGHSRSVASAMLVRHREIKT